MGKETPSLDISSEDDDENGSPVKLSGVFLNKSSQGKEKLDIKLNMRSKLSVVQKLSFAFDEFISDDDQTLEDISQDVREYQRVRGWSNGSSEPWSMWSRSSKELAGCSSSFLSDHTYHREENEGEEVFIDTSSESE
ncbi:hypothetical protein G5714_002510 [Onychostoma macrolepis]|uniref:Uncharacterized protein n=1 Tax=Onychostoma macrolepis TaxID=369639 RepID=A0A7J6D706_9TELE|nr:hypothetical protein G5714_002510 [Onychostoma macrolepis]